MHFDGEVMRIFQSAGLAEKIAAVVRSSSRGMHFVNGEGRTLMIRRGIDGPGPHGWAGNWYFHQPILEGVLREGLKRFRQCARRISATRSASVDALDARYVVGCDGARSLVRQPSAASTAISACISPGWSSISCAIPTSPRVKALPDYTVQLCDPARPMTVVNVGGDRRRWEIMLMPGDDPARLTEPDVFWPMMARWLGPTMRGSNAPPSTPSIRWCRKAGARAGFCWPAMPATRRRPSSARACARACAMRPTSPGSSRPSFAAVHPRRCSTPTKASACRMCGTFIDLAVRLGAVLQETDRDAAAARDRRFEAGAEMFDFPQPQLGPGCRADAPPPVGTIFPQPRLADGRLMDEVIGQRFAILGDAALLEGFESAAVLLPGVGMEWLAGHGARAVVLRPDRYIFCLANDRAAISAAFEALFYHKLLY